jgi:hypothetical protein
MYQKMRVHGLGSICRSRSCRIADICRRAQINVNLFSPSPSPSMENKAKISACTSASRQPSQPVLPGGRSSVCSNPPAETYMAWRSCLLQHPPPSARLPVPFPPLPSPSFPFLCTRCLVFLPCGNLLARRTDARRPEVCFIRPLFLFSTSIDLYRPRETSCYCSRLRRGGDRLRRIEMEREINWNCVA